MSAQSKLLSLDLAQARLYVAKGQDLVVKRVNVLGINKINVKTLVTKNCFYLSWYLNEYFY